MKHESTQFIKKSWMLQIREKSQSTIRATVPSPFRTSPTNRDHYHLEINEKSQFTIHPYRTPPPTVPLRRIDGGRRRPSGAAFYHRSPRAGTATNRSAPPAMGEKRLNLSTWNFDAAGKPLSSTTISRVQCEEYCGDTNTATKQHQLSFDSILLLFQCWITKISSPVDRHFTSPIREWAHSTGDYSCFNVVSQKFQAREITSSPPQ